MIVEKPKQDINTMQQMLYRSHGFKPPHRNMTPLEMRAHPLMDMSREIATRGSVLREPRHNAIMANIRESVPIPRSKTSMHNRNHRFNRDMLISKQNLSSGILTETEAIFLS